MISDFLAKRKTITDVAKDLGVTREYVHRYYLKIAMQSTDFPEDYPKLGDKIFTDRGLSEYQQWVLKRLRGLVKAGMTQQQFLYKDEDGFIEFAPEIDYHISKTKYFEELKSKPEQQFAQLSD